ncbi:four-helix bundle copper-binding protein [Halobacillus salinarum]|uniref:Four-helix bundle copper-binding protein n=1 Tax=Halobacillus salinarum TaxID=2932257 RepID=A0ABY4EMX5_9BACI|nr:four-helix bundle copper-binding protein [Halobacillus salinarum]UOQ45335.1 four-helix bundle copper-binding protein [Halobacillus salinarum]
MPDNFMNSLLKRTQLLHQCQEAFQYAVEMVQKNAGDAESICKSCAELCKDCADECLQIENDEFQDPLYLMCLDYAKLCEGIIAFQKKMPLPPLKESS